MYINKSISATGFIALAMLLQPLVTQAADPSSPQGVAHRVKQLEEQVSALQEQLHDLSELTKHMSLQNVNGKPTVVFSGVNVQIINGLGTTESANGTGNLVVGYNEPDNSGWFRCTLGWNADLKTPVIGEDDCTAAGGSWIDTGFKTGSHNLIIGSRNNYSRWGGIVSGEYNTANYDYASVNGGQGNAANGPFSSVSGGTDNTASSEFSRVSGGWKNNATSPSSSVNGGYKNFASGPDSVVCGGNENNASGFRSSVSGGSENSASGNYSSVLGGNKENAATDYQTIPLIP